MVCASALKPVTLNLVVEQFGLVKRDLERSGIQRVSPHVGT